MTRIVGMNSSIGAILADGIWVGGSGVILFLLLVIVLILLWRRGG